MPAGSVSNQTMNGYMDALAQNYAGGNGRAMTPSQIAMAVGIPQQYRTAQYLPASTPSSNASYISSAGGAKTAGVQPSQGPVVETNGGQRLGTTTGAGGTYLPSASAFTTASTNSGGPAPAPDAYGGATNLPQNFSDPADWRFQGSDTAYSTNDLERMLNDPYFFQRQFLQSRGLNTPSANAALGQYASRLNPLAFLLTASQMSPDAQGDYEDIANAYQGLISNYITPGGRMPDTSEIMNILLGVGDVGNGGAPANLLQSVLTGQDPQGQVQAVNQILGAALAGMPGLFGTGWSNLLDQWGTNYMDSTADAYGGLGNTYLSYLRDNPFANQVAGR